MIWFNLAMLAGGYVLAIFSWPKLRLRLVTWRNDPIGAIEKDIAALRALADRLRGG